MTATIQDFDNYVRQTYIPWAKQQGIPMEYINLFIADKRKEFLAQQNQTGSNYDWKVDDLGRVYVFNKATGKYEISGGTGNDEFGADEGEFGGTAQGDTTALDKYLNNINQGQSISGEVVNQQSEPTLTKPGEQTYNFGGKGITAPTLEPPQIPGVDTNKESAIKEYIDSVLNKLQVKPKTIKTPTGEITLSPNIKLY